MIFGLTIDNAFSIDRAVKFIPTLSVRPLCRVVIDEGVALTEYVEPIKELSTVASIMIQIQDSYGDKKLSDSSLIKKAVGLVKLFPGVVDFEIANEINGDWCHPNAVKRMQSLSDILRGKERWVTLFMQPGMLDWWTLNAVACEYLTVSHYPEDLDGMNQEWGKIFTRLAGTPGVKGVGFGEFGTENFSGKKYGLVEMIEYYYSKFEAPKYIGFGGMWDFQSAMNGKGVLAALKKMSEGYK